MSGFWIEDPPAHFGKYRKKKKLHRFFGSERGGVIFFWKRARGAKNIDFPKIFRNRYKNSSKAIFFRNLRFSGRKLSKTAFYRWKYLLGGLSRFWIPTLDWPFRPRFRGLWKPKKSIFPKFLEISIKPVIRLFLPEIYVFEFGKGKKNRFRGVNDVQSSWKKNWPPSKILDSGEKKIFFWKNFFFEKKIFFPKKFFFSIFFFFLILLFGMIFL